MTLPAALGGARRSGAHLLGSVLQTLAGDVAQRLHDDVPAHLRVADLALDELDRHLDDAKPARVTAHGHVHLEPVPPRVDRVQVHRPRSTDVR